MRRKVANDARIEPPTQVEYLKVVVMAMVMVRQMVMEMVIEMTIVIEMVMVQYHWVGMTTGMFKAHMRSFGAYIRIFASLGAEPRISFSKRSPKPME